MLIRELHGTASGTGNGTPGSGTGRHRILHRRVLLVAVCRFPVSFCLLLALPLPAVLLCFRYVAVFRLAVRVVLARRAVLLALFRSPAFFCLVLFATTEGVERVILLLFLLLFLFLFLLFLRLFARRRCKVPATLDDQFGAESQCASNDVRARGGRRHRGYGA